MVRRLAPLALLLVFAHAPPARAEVQNCTVITSLPTTLSVQGLYCLKADLATAIATGNAITINANNITIDCNGFKIGGLAAGDATRTNGISADGRLNSVIRHCAIRGFYVGVFLNDGGGHVVEENRFDGNTYAAIGLFSSDGGIIRRNLVVDTGGNLPLDVFPEGRALGIAVQEMASVLVQENVVSNTYSTASSGRSASGIAMFSGRGIIRDNSVQGVTADGIGLGYGIYSLGSVATFRGNTLISVGVDGHGIYASPASLCMDNVVMGFATSMMLSCTDGGGNNWLP